MARIAFIGVGNMGGPMLGNLVKAGHSVTAFDLSAPAREAAHAAGATLADGAVQAAKGAEIVITMLPAGQHVRAVLLEGGVLKAAAKSTLFIDCSTIDVETARLVHKAAAEGGHELLDAPVSGGTAGAAAATLTFMVGGGKNAFERAEPILRTMGKEIIHAGPSGNGQAAKICNNLILGITMIGVSEALTLSKRLGLDAATLHAISSKSSGSCWALNEYCPAPGPVPKAPSNRDYQPGFTAQMMLKDLKLALDAAQSTDSAVPLGAVAESLYALYCGAGNSAKDFSGIIQMIQGKG
ncbi:MAG: 3-hydroxyisobutyrate dehydrogenase [Alphaproteobacteria bacterium]|nr:3-hydroxyisobutyrate dehydrogenase [Alphaproteobacteria bacterium]